MEASLRGELAEVNTFLSSIEEQLEALLQQQSEYMERRRLLTLQLETLVHDKHHADLPPGTSQSPLPPPPIDWENTSFSWSEGASTLLKSRFKIDSFRPLQWSCINATLSGHDVILVMPTGGGKSLCYQLPALLVDGLTLVVSPLVSLMEDQLLAVKTLGIESAMLTASTSREVVNCIHSDMTDTKGTLRLLYVTPEKVSKNKRFMSKLEKCYTLGRLTRIVIDEVHCASQWGHDFRPDYKVLGVLKRQFPNAPLLGLTATATAKVLEDCKEMLCLPEGCVVFRASYNRANLYYEVRAKPPTSGEQVSVLSELMKTTFCNQSGIVYCLSRKDTEQVSGELSQKGIKAACYHADMAPEERTRVHMQWLNNKLQVIVATVAFGMGIDKPDVRFVFHHTLSKSMENYYQESGRAGRDGNPAHCIIFYRSADAFRQSSMVMTERVGLQNLYSLLRYCLNQVDCRRQLIARSFGEQWKPSDCPKACDVCTLLSSASPVRYHEDVTGHCRALIVLLEQAASKEQRVTPLKLMELWRGKGGGGSGATLSHETCERILVHAVLEEVLKEEFHFTPYTTISYIGMGRKAEGVKSGAIKVKIASRFRSNSEANDDDVKLVSTDIRTSTGEEGFEIEARIDKGGGCDTGVTELERERSLPTVSKRKRKAPEIINLD